MELELFNADGYDVRKAVQKVLHGPDLYDTEAGVPTLQMVQEV
jgi:hypothetical protein